MCAHHWFVSFVTWIWRRQPGFEPLAFDADLQPGPLRSRATSARLRGLPPQGARHGARDEPHRIKQKPLVRCSRSQAGPFVSASDGSVAPRARGLQHDERRSFDRRAALASVNASFRARGTRPEPVALLPSPHGRTSRRRRPSGSSTVAPGCACRLSHQAGSGSAQPFIAGIDQVRAVLDEADDRDPRPCPVRRPTVCQPEHPPLRLGRGRRPNRPRGDRVRRAVRDPDRADQPARHDRAWRRRLPARSADTSDMARLLRGVCVYGVDYTVNIALHRRLVKSPGRSECPTPKERDRTWRPGHRDHRAPSPADRERVLQAAIELADRDGLEALSMRKLGQELGRRRDGALPPRPEQGRPARRHHRASSSARSSGRTRPGRGRRRPRGRSWRRGSVMLRHPWARRVLEERGTGGLAVIDYIESMLAILRGGGFSLDLAHHTMHVLGQPHLRVQPGPVRRQRAGGALARRRRDVRAAMAARFPRVTELAMSVSHEGVLGALRRRRGVRVRARPDPRRPRAADPALAGPELGGGRAAPSRAPARRPSSGPAPRRSPRGRSAAA